MNEPPMKRSCAEDHGSFVKRVRMMNDAMKVIEDVQRAQTLHEESLQLMVKGVSKCSKLERYHFFVTFAKELPSREPLITEILSLGVFDTTIADIDVFMVVFRTARTPECLRNCAKEVARIVARKTFPPVSHDTWIELFAIGVDLLRRFMQPEFESLLDAWIRKSEFLKRHENYNIRLEDISDSFDVLVKERLRSYGYVSQFLSNWVLKMNTRW